MGTRYAVLLTAFMVFFFMVIPVGVLTVWFGFLLLPIPWAVAWLGCGVLFAPGIYVWVLSKREFDRVGQNLHSKTGVTLVTTGIYASIRHPHYLGLMLFPLSIALGLKSLVSLLMALVNVIIGYWFTVEEEKALIQQFGDEYREYEARVPMFIPTLWKKSQ
jgi:protein-S-isoprenylcysteine O-methyltransferase Ste14